MSCYKCNNQRAACLAYRCELRIALYCERHRNLKFLMDKYCWFHYDKPDYEREQETNIKYIWHGPKMTKKAKQL